MSWRTLIAVILVSALTAVLAVQFAGKPGITSTDPVYDRIMKTGVIRCGYINWYPAILKDPNTGEMKGYVVEYFEALAKALDVKIEWAEELNLGTYLNDLNNGRYDLECAGGWASATRGKLIYYTDPFAYSPLVPFVRAADARFDQNFDSLFQPGLSAAVVDGDTSQNIRTARFPAMKEISIPQNAAINEYFLMVATGKADMTFSDHIGGMRYIESNPGTIKPLPYVLRLVPQNIGVPQGENRLLSMLNTVNQQLLLDGTVDSILDRYETQGVKFIRTTQGLGLAQRREGR
jgi:ABC-type amino acid transport substrate-binding protein